MAKKRYTHQQIRKSLKKDELRDMLTRAVDFAKGNTENLLIAAIIVGVLAVLLPMYFRHQADNEVRAASLLEQAIYYNLQPVQTESPDALRPSFKTLAEKYQKCREAYAEVANTYPNTRAARLGRLGEANSLFFLGKYTEAQGVYQAELDKLPKDFLAPTLRERIGACQENLQKWPEALATYQALLAEDPGYFNRRSVRLAEARCLFHLGKTAEARKLLDAEEQQGAGDFWSEAAREEAQYQEQAGR